MKERENGDSLAEELADLDDAVGDADGDEVGGLAGPEEQAVGGRHAHPQVDRVGAAHQAGGQCTVLLCTAPWCSVHCTALWSTVLCTAPYFCCISGLLKKR